MLPVEVDLESEEINDIQIFENVTPDVLRSVVNDLNHSTDWIRLKARDIILNRTRPPRHTRRLKTGIVAIRTLDDVVLAKEKIFFKMLTAQITKEECKEYMLILDSIKDTLSEAKYVNLILTFKEFLKNNEAFQNLAKTESILSLQ